MRFVWFWTFWHWSKEGFRAGSLLRSPLHGIGSHWDEWVRHEASDSDRVSDIAHRRDKPLTREGVDDFSLAMDYGWATAILRMAADWVEVGLVGVGRVNPVSCAWT